MKGRKVFLPPVACNCYWKWRMETITIWCVDYWLIYWLWQVTKEKHLGILLVSWCFACYHMRVLEVPLLVILNSFRFPSKWLNHPYPRWGHLSALGWCLCHRLLWIWQHKQPQPPTRTAFDKVCQNCGGSIYWDIAAEKDNSNANVTVEVHCWW